jgi:hypothetical protein
MLLVLLLLHSVIVSHLIVMTTGVVLACQNDHTKDRRRIANVRTRSVRETLRALLTFLVNIEQTQERPRPLSLTDCVFTNKQQLQSDITRQVSQPTPERP